MRRIMRIHNKQQNWIQVPASSQTFKKNNKKNYETLLRVAEEIG